MTPLDDRFIHRVYRTSVWVTLLAALAAMTRWGAPVALGLIAGSAYDLACIWLTERGVRKFIRPGVRSYQPLALYALGMYPALLVVLWALVYCHLFNVMAIAAGVLLPNVVIVLKVVGRNLVRTTPDGKAVSNEGTNKEPGETDSGRQ